MRVKGKEARWLYQAPVRKILQTHTLAHKSQCWPPRIIRFLGCPIIRCSQTQVQASKLKELHPFS